MFYISTGLAGVALLLSIYVLISLNGKKMSDLTKAGSGRAENNKSEENETELNSKTTKKDKNDLKDIDDIITYF